MTNDSFTMFSSRQPKYEACRRNPATLSHSGASLDWTPAVDRQPSLHRECLVKLLVAPLNHSYCSLRVANSFEKCSTTLRIDFEVNSTSELKKSSRGLDYFILNKNRAKNIGDPNRARNTLRDPECAAQSRDRNLGPSAQNPNLYEHILQGVR